MTWKFEHAIPHLGTITEGPAWNGHNLLFSNIAMNRVLQLNPDNGALGTFAVNTEGVNGLNFDGEGRLYGCAGGGRRIVEFSKDGNMRTVGEFVDGKRLNGPNDLAIHPSGRIYFSDRIDDVYPDMGIEYSAILSIEPERDDSYECVRRTFDTSMPNGLLFSSDYKTLYVAQSDYRASEQRELRAYPVQDDGSLGEKRILHNFGPHRGIDGMTLSKDGLIVACTGWELSGPGGCITIFDPNGVIVATHPVPTDRPTNCTFVENSIYVTSIDGCLLRAETEIEGYLLWP